MLCNILVCNTHGLLNINGRIFHHLSIKYMEVELLWRCPNAPSVALRGGLRLLRLAELVRYNQTAIGGPQKNSSQ